MTPTLPTTKDVALYAEVWGEPFVTVRVEAQIVGPGGDVVAEHEPGGVVLDEEGITLFALPLPAVPIASSGIYMARLLHEGREVARRRFRVDLEVSTATRTA